MFVGVKTHTITFISSTILQHYDRREATVHILVMVGVYNVNNLRTQTKGVNTMRILSPSSDSLRGNFYAQHKMDAALVADSISNS